MAKNKDRYTVVHPFKDLQDGNKKYEVGDKFPKPANKKISDERIKELSTTDNKQKKILIEKIEEAIVKEIVEVEETKADNEEE